MDIVRGVRCGTRVGHRSGTASAGQEGFGGCNGAGARAAAESPEGERISDEDAVKSFWAARTGWRLSISITRRDRTAAETRQRRGAKPCADLWATAISAVWE